MIRSALHLGLFTIISPTYHAAKVHWFDRLSYSGNTRIPRMCGVKNCPGCSGKDTSVPTSDMLYVLATDQHGEEVICGITPTVRKELNALDPAEFMRRYTGSTIVVSRKPHSTPIPEIVVDLLDGYTDCADKDWLPDLHKVISTIKTEEEYSDLRLMHFRATMGVCHSFPLYTDTDKPVDGFIPFKSRISAYLQNYVGSFSEYEVDVIDEKVVVGRSVIATYSSKYGFPLFDFRNTDYNDVQRQMLSRESTKVAAYFSKSDALYDTLVTRLAERFTHDITEAQSKIHNHHHYFIVVFDVPLHMLAEINRVVRCVNIADYIVMLSTSHFFKCKGNIIALPKAEKLESIPVGVACVS